MAKEYDPNERKPMQRGSLQKRADDAASKFFSATGNVADRFAGGAGARAAIGFAGDVGKGLASDRQKTKKFAAVTSGNLGENQDMMPDGRNFKTAATMPVTRPATKIRGTAQAAETPPQQVPAVTERATRSQNKESQTSRIGKTFTDNGETMTITGPPPKQGPRTFRSDGTYTNNDTGLSVQFDPSTSQAPRQAFMRQPTQPGSRARSDMPGKEWRNFGPQKLESAQRRPMGQKERIAMSQIGQQEADSVRRERQSMAASDLERQRLGLDETRIGGELERDRMSAGLTQAQTAETQARTARMEQEQNIISQFQTEQDPQKREQLRKQYLTLQGKDPRDGDLSQGDKIKAEIDAVKLYNEYVEGERFSGREPLQQSEWFKTLPPNVAAVLGSGQEELEPAPADISKRVKGKQYRGPNGVAVWNGEGWEV